MSQAINLSNPGRPLQVGVILVSEYGSCLFRVPQSADHDPFAISATELLDVAGIDMLNGISKNFIRKELPLEQKLKDQAIDMQIHWIAETASHPRCLTSGLSVNVTDTFETCPPLDIALIGAGPIGYEPTPTELAFIRSAYETCSAFLTVCGGVEYALKAGILSGKTATGPRMIIPIVQKAAPDVNWEERRWCRDGKLWTSGALVNGLDMMREFIEEYWGGEGSLARLMGQSGSAPVRDRDYKDDYFEVRGWQLPGDGVAA